MKNIILLILLILNYTLVFSQDYKRRVELNDISKDGFNKIILNSEITSHLKHGFADLRLYDNNKNEVPFIYGDFFGNKASKRRVFFKVKRNKKNKIKQKKTLILENTENILISNLGFTISNNKSKIPLKIYGSNNKKKWYVIKKNFSAQTNYDNIEKKILLIKNLPKTNFRYYKVLFYNSSDNKTKVHQAFFYEDKDSIYYKKIIEQPKIKHKDTLNKTIVYLKYNEAQFIDKIKFNIKGTKYYYRRAELTKIHNGADNSVTELFYDDLQKDIIFDSDTKNEIYLYDYKAKTIKIIIFNKDDSPIRIKSVDTYQKENFIIAYLQKTKKYYLQYDSKTAKFPIYDLSHFTEKIPDTIPVLNLKKGKNNVKNNKKKVVWNFPKKYLWIAALFIASLLLFLTLRIMIDKYKNNKL